MIGRVFYLDCPNEIGSLAILRELKVSVNQSTEIDFQGERHDLSRTHFFCKERQSEVPVAYKVTSDYLYAGLS